MMWRKHKSRTVHKLLLYVADGARGRKEMKERTTVEGGIGDGHREACLDCTLLLHPAKIEERGGERVEMIFSSCLL